MQPERHWPRRSTVDPSETGAWVEWLVTSYVGSLTVAKGSSPMAKNDRTFDTLEENKQKMDLDNARMSFCHCDVQVEIDKICCCKVITVTR